jgi:hypothetical protein
MLAGKVRMKISPLRECSASDAAIRMAFLAVLVVVLGRADTIEMKSGERVDGAFKQASSASAVIEVAGQAITIPLEKVKAIYFGAPPTQAGAGPTLQQEAMDTLRALRSVTTSGIGYRDYAQRVSDARVKVDRYLASPTKDPARRVIDLAMRYYEIARDPFANGILNGTGTIIAGDPTLQVCTTLQAASVNMRSRTGEQGLKSAGSVMLYVGKNPEVLWTCASEQLTEAESLIRQH